MKTLAGIVAIAGVCGWATLEGAAAQQNPAPQAFAFRTSVNSVNVAVTVTDANGHFVPNLRAEDFIVLEDGKPQAVAQFDSERVPVSLGLALDTSGSMAGPKIQAAQAALRRFLFDLLDPTDEVFLYRFDSRPELVQSWTTDRTTIAHALELIRPNGGTAIYDTVAEAIPMTQAGNLKKKALLLISDGQDMNSHMHLDEVRQRIRESEVLVYAVGIEDEGRLSSSSAPATTSSNTKPLPTPSPFPGKTVASAPPASSSASSPSLSSGSSKGCGGFGNSKDRIGAETLHQLTDDSGGRTEIICTQRDLDPATAGIADELRRQYFLAYTSGVPKDGRWHTIEVQLKKSGYHVRSRRGFIAG
jgi:VWFA-related protein